MILELAAFLALSSPALEPPPARHLSLVIARSGKQWDPIPAPCSPRGHCDDFHYRSTFARARTLAGDPLPPAFEARLLLHTPYISEYTLALIVERRDDGSLLVLRQTGFNGRNGVGCFNDLDEFPVDWHPSGPQIQYQRETLCVSDPSQIEPNAPKD